MSVLDNLEATFGHIKKVGADGERLSNELREMVKHMDNIIITFEAGMQSQEWSGNFATYGGEDSIAWATAVYTELKTTRQKLKEYGL